MVITSTPRFMLSSDWVEDWELVVLSSFFFFRCTSLSSDLYMPRCRPDGEVEVFSGHFLNPSINLSKLRGCALALKWLGRSWCFRKALVALSMGKVSRFTVPLITDSAKGVMLSVSKSVDNGSIVNGDPCAVAKCCWQKLRSCRSMSFASSTVVHLLGSLGSGVSRCVSPPGEWGFRTDFMAAKHRRLSSACRRW